MNIQTSDKSFTLFNQTFQEHYHSTSDGALQETLHKHIFPSFAYFKNKPKLKILDICFGLGYNTLCAIKYAQIYGISTLEIHSPEMDFSLLESLQSLHYPRELTQETLKILAPLIQNRFYKDENIEVFLHLGDARAILEGFKTRQESPFDIVFQDAFSPHKNPLLWTYEYFKTLFLLTQKDCILTTYSHNSAMLYSAFLAGFKPFKLTQKHTRDSILLRKLQSTPSLELENILTITPINLPHKIATNKNLKGLYDSNFAPLKPL